MSETTAQSEKQFSTPSAALNRFSGSARTLSTDSALETSGLRYGFRVGNLGFLITSMIPMEVLEPMSVYPIPNTVGWLKGLINLRGSLVPIFDLTTLFGETSDLHNTSSLILVLGKAEDAVGIPISQRPESLDNLSLLDQLPPMPSELKNQVNQAFMKDQKVWFEFNHQAFFHSLADKVPINN